jgi:hypothetical protein
MSRRMKRRMDGGDGAEQWRLWCGDGAEQWRRELRSHGCGAPMGGAAVGSGRQHDHGRHGEGVGGRRRRGRTMVRRRRGGEQRRNGSAEENGAEERRIEKKI